MNVKSSRENQVLLRGKRNGGVILSLPWVPHRPIQKRINSIGTTRKGCNENSPVLTLIAELCCKSNVWPTLGVQDSQMMFKCIYRYTIGTNWGAIRHIYGGRTKSRGIHISWFRITEKVATLLDGEGQNRSRRTPKIRRYMSPDCDGQVDYEEIIKQKRYEDTLFQVLLMRHYQCHAYKHEQFKCSIRVSSE